MPHKALDPRRMRVFSLSERMNQLTWDASAVDPDAAPPRLGDALEKQLDRLADRIRAARDRGASVMMTYGAHLVKNKAAPVVRALVEAGWITHLATQGAGVIHDFEFALQGATGESVRENAPAGRFGTWDETGRWINLAVASGVACGLGFGESVGRMLSQGKLALPSIESMEQAVREAPIGERTAALADLVRMMRTHGLPEGEMTLACSRPEASILAGAYEKGVPMTIHPGIGYDIIVNHPMYNGAAMGRAAEIDVRIFAESVDRLDGGVYLSIGSAIMSPQVFEKALSLVNNVRNAEGRPTLSDHFLAVVDLQDTGGWDWTRGEPPHDHPAYYLRFCKSFHRMGGVLDYLQCDNRDLLLGLWGRLRG